MSLKKLDNFVVNLIFQLWIKRLECARFNFQMHSMNVAHKWHAFSYKIKVGRKHVQ